MGSFPPNAVTAAAKNTHPVIVLMDSCRRNAGTAAAKTIRRMIALMGSFPPNAGTAAAKSIQPVSVLMDSFPPNAFTVAAITIRLTSALMGCSGATEATTNHRMTPQIIRTPAIQAPRPRTGAILGTRPAVRVAVLRLTADAVGASVFWLLPLLWWSPFRHSPITPVRQRALCPHLTRQHDILFIPTRNRRTPPPTLTTVQVLS